MHPETLKQGTMRIVAGNNDERNRSRSHKVGSADGSVVIVLEIHRIASYGLSLDLKHRRLVHKQGVRKTKDVPIKGAHSDRRGPRMFRRRREPG